jgi:lysophospholipase L1-like esterase
MKWTLALMGIAAGLLVVECGLRPGIAGDALNRPYGPPGITWLVTDPVLGWKNEPGFSDPPVSINSDGFVGAPIHRDKPPGAIRIAFLGDSGTFGFCKTGEDQFEVYGFPARLAARFRAGNRGDIQVINAGVLGYTSSQGLRQLQTRILRLRPDVVVVRFGFNDHSPAHDLPRRIVEPESRLARGALYRFSDWGLLRLGLLAWRSLPVHDAPHKARWVELERFEKNLRRFAELATMRDFDLLFMDYPLRDVARTEPKHRSPAAMRLVFGVETMEDLLAVHEKYQQAMLGTAREAEVPVLRTTPFCRAAEAPCFGDHDFAHPNRSGAELLAELVHQDLAARGWLEPHVAD